jgi:hypothetical protein
VSARRTFEPGTRSCVEGFWENIAASPRCRDEASRAARDARTRVVECSSVRDGRTQTMVLRLRIISRGKSTGICFQRLSRAQNESILEYGVFVKPKSGVIIKSGLKSGSDNSGAGARPLRGRAPRMSRVQPARAYDALYGAWGTRATPSRPTRATPRAPRGRLTAHRSPHPPPNVAFSQTPCTPCPGRGTTTASRRAPPTPRRLCLCGRTCSPRAPTTRRMRRGASAPRPPNARFHHRSPLSRNLSRVHI